MTFKNDVENEVLHFFFQNHCFPPAFSKRTPTFTILYHPATATLNLSGNLTVFSKDWFVGIGSLFYLSIWPHFGACLKIEKKDTNLMQFMNKYDKLEVACAV